MPLPKNFGGGTFLYAPAFTAAASKWRLHRGAGFWQRQRCRRGLLRQTGSLIESPSGYLHLTTRENLEIVADLKGVPHKDIDRVLDIVQLTKDQHRKMGQYSLGMKQRLGITMALLDSPKPLPVLRANGLTAATVGAYNTIALPPLRDDLLAGLVQALADSGAGVVGLTQHTKTLEEIFLTLTAPKKVG